MQTLVAPTFKPIHSTSAHPLKIVALGDSIVYGFGDPEGGGWVERLRRSWMSPDSPGPILYNLGIRGDGVKQVAQRLEQEFRHRGEIRNSVPDTIILSVGVNDSARLGHPNGRQFTEFDVFEAELANLLDHCLAMQQHRRYPSPTPSLLFVGMVPVDPSKMPFLNSFYFNHADQYRYKEATRLACEARNIPYLDIFDLWLRRGTEWCYQQLCVDGLHPNVAGYQALLQDVRNWEPFSQLAAPTNVGF
jgi:lysophospholipase L1-like esterase